MTGHEKDKTLVGGASSLDPQSFDPIRHPIFPFIMMIWVTLFEPKMTLSVCVPRCGTYANQKEYIFFVSHGVGILFRTLQIKPEVIITINFTNVLHYFELKPEDFI